jgi:hypothetical protein
VRRVQPGQFLVFQQQGRGRVVHAAQHPGPGRRHPHPVGGQRPQDLGGRVRVYRAAERAGDPGRQVGHLGRPQPRHRARAEQLGEQLVVHVSPPRQPVEAHFRRDQAAGRLRRDQQREPPRMLVRRDPPLLAGVHLDDGAQGRAGVGEDRVGRVEQGVLAGTRGRRGPGRDGRSRRPAEPGPGPRQGRGLTRPALPREQQGLGQGDVVAALHPHPGPQQRGVDAGCLRPDPPSAAGSLVRRDGRGTVIMPNDRPVAGAVLRQLGQPATVPWPRDDGDPHGSDSRLPGRQPRTPEGGVWPRPGP